MRPTYEELLSCLAELADLMDDVVSGDYKPDTFTTQPARRLLGLAPAPAVSRG